MNDEFVNMVNAWICEILGTQQETESGYPCEDHVIESDDCEDTEAEWIGKTDNIIINCSTCGFHGVINTKKNPYIIGQKKHWLLKKRIMNCPRCKKQIAIASKPGEL